MRSSLKNSRLKSGLVLPTTLWAVIFVIAALAAGIWLHQYLRGYEVVANVHQTPILRAQYERALWAHLWQGGTPWEKLSDQEKWETKRVVLNHLIEEALLAQHAIEVALPEDKLQAATTAEHRQFKKHFPAHSPYAKRLELQQISDSEFKKKLYQEEVQLHQLEQIFKEDLPESSALSPSVKLPNRLKISHIFLSKTGTKKKSRAQELARIRTAILKGELTFGAAAKQHSSDLRSNKTEGLLGWVSEDRLLPSLMVQLKDLPLHEISEPLESSIGWHLVQIHDRKPASVAEPPPDEAKAYLEDQHRNFVLENWFKPQREAAEIVSNRGVLERCQPRL